MILQGHSPSKNYTLLTTYSPTCVVDGDVGDNCAPILSAMSRSDEFSTAAAS